MTEMREERIEKKRIGKDKWGDQIECKIIRGERMDRREKKKCSVG